MCEAEDGICGWSVTGGLGDVCKGQVVLKVLGSRGGRC